MSKTLSIPFKTDINELFARGVKESKAYNGKFIGDAKNGQFDFKAAGGEFKGSYVVKANSIDIQFDRKPIFIPILVIETFLKLHIK